MWWWCGSLMNDTGPCCAGVHRVRCDVANQTVIVSGNVPPQTLLRRIRWIKRRSEILSIGGPYTGSSYGPDYLPYNPYANERYPMSPPFSNYETFPVNEEYDMEYGSGYGPSSYIDPYRRPYPGVGYYWYLESAILICKSVLCTYAAVRYKWLLKMGGRKNWCGIQYR